MEDRWQSALVAFRTNRYQTAAEHVAHALAAASSPFHSSVLQINAHAIHVEQGKTKPAPPHVVATKTGPCVFLQAEEASITAAYNLALAALRVSVTDDRAVCALENILTRVVHVVSWLKTPQQQFFIVEKKKLSHQSISDAIHALLLNYHHLIQNKPLCTHARRWADAAASAYELVATSYLYRRCHTQALTISATAQRLRHLEKSLLPETSVPVQDVNMTAEDPSILAPVSEIVAEHAQQQDNQCARADYLVALSYAASNNFSYSLTQTRPHTQYHSDDDQIHLPTAYLTAVLLLIEGKETEQAVRLLQLCAARAYRTADSLALIARTKRGNEAIQSWQRVFAMDYRRPAALWTAAKVFGRQAQWNKQAELLSCLQEILQDGVEKTSMLCIGHGSDASDVLSVENVTAEHARALCGAGKWSQAREMIMSIETEMGSRSDVLRDRAWAEISMGDTETAIRLADDAYVESTSSADAAAALLAKAEALLCDEKVTEAREAVLSAFREAKLGEVQKSEADTLLRGICYHNMGVLHACKQEYIACDECLAAAQTAFEKCDGAFAVFAKRFAVMAGFARCLCMWGQGRKEDAAGHWVAKRGLDLSDDFEVVEDIGMTGKKEIVCDVGDDVLQQFDRICVEVCRAVEERKKVDAVRGKVEAKNGARQTGSGDIDLQAG